MTKIKNNNALHTNKKHVRLIPTALPVLLQH